MGWYGFITKLANNYYLISYNYGCYSSSFKRYLNKQIVINLGTDFDLEVWDKIVLQNDDEVCDITQVENTDSYTSLNETKTSYFSSPNIGQTFDIPVAGQYDPQKFDSNLIKELNGQILLQVESYGEAWYMNPADNTRYYMKDGDTAYQMMRGLGLGITDGDLTGIPIVENTTEANIATNVCGSNILANKVKGKILLQVEKHGEAWYVDPGTCNRIYMKDGDSAYTIMRYLSLGITDEDLSKIPSGSIQ